MPKLNGEVVQTDQLRKRERVIAAESLVGVPEGTAGSVVLATGIGWIRYWVRFDNGVERGSIDRSKLVREKLWDRYLVQRAEAAEAAALAEEQGPAAEDTAAGDDVASGDAKVVNGVTVPPHLLTRSANARTRLGA